MLVGSGLYTTFSRGALFEYAIGMVMLVVLCRRREQLRGAVVSVTAAVLGAGMTAPFHCVTALAGPRSTAETQGAIVLAGIVVLALLAAGVQLRLAAHEDPGELKLPRYAAQIAGGLVVALMALAIVVGSTENSTVQLGGGAGRLTALSSSRYAYWRVALDTFDQEPVRGIGAGGWSVYWLERQGNNGFAQDAHSLPLQTMSELGLIGLALSDHAGDRGGDGRAYGTADRPSRRRGADCRARRVVRALVDRLGLADAGRDADRVWDGGPVGRVVRASRGAARRARQIRA